MLSRCAEDVSSVAQVRVSRQMDQNTRARNSPDSFLETLNAEIVSGTESLHAWLKHLENCGGVDLLFQLECWVKGLSAFFDIRHLPLKPLAPSGLLQRSFAAELRIVREAIQRSEQFASQVISLGQPTHVEFEKFVEAQLRRERAIDYNLSAALEQPTPLDSLVRMLDFLNDTRVLLDSMLDSSRRDYQLYLSIGRCFRRELRDCRYVDMLLSQRFRLQYDREDRPALSALLRGIPDDRLRRNVALAFLYLFRLLKYVALISADLANDVPMRPALVLFALIHKEIDGFCEFLKSRLARGREGDHRTTSAVELIVFSLKAGLRRIFEQELSSAALEPDAGLIFRHMEAGCGLLGRCVQSGLVSLAQAFEISQDAQMAFPFFDEKAAKAHEVQHNLWALRQFLREALDRRGELPLDLLIARLSQFRETSVRALIYGDLAELERFSDELITAGNFQEVRALLKRLITYIEALVQEVSARDVVREMSVPGQGARAVVDNCGGIS